MFSEDKIPPCACTAHPSGEPLRKYMFVAEETPEYVVWCCQRCSEIARTPVIQVRTMDFLKQKARHERRVVDAGKERIIAKLRALKKKRQVMVNYAEAEK